MDERALSRPLREIYSQPDLKLADLDLVNPAKKRPKRPLHKVEKFLSVKIRENPWQKIPKYPNSSHPAHSLQ
jgi:hypothetical protein